MQCEIFLLELSNAVTIPNTVSRNCFSISRICFLKFFCGLVCHWHHRYTDKMVCFHMYLIASLNGNLSVREMMWPQIFFIYRVQLDLIEAIVHYLSSGFYLLSAIFIFCFSWSWMLVSAYWDNSHWLHYSYSHILSCLWRNDIKFRKFGNQHI